MFRPEILEKIEQELARGEQARQKGLEGQARVCARRAAGIAIRAYLELRGEPVPGPNALDLLEHLRAQPGNSERMQQVIAHLLARVTEAFDLPFEADLLAETRWLVTELHQASEGNNG